MREYWLIDSLRRRVDWYTLVDGRYVMIDTGDDGKLHSKVLPGVWFRDGWFFDRPTKSIVLKEWAAV